VVVFRVDWRFGVLKDDRERISYLEQRLSPERVVDAGPQPAELEMLADLYMQSDSYLPALETIDRLLSLPASRRLTAERRLALEAKAVACRLARGEAQSAVAHARELLRETPTAADGLRAGLLLECARGEFALGRIDEATTSAGRALELADRLNDQSKSAAALTLLGITAYRRGDLLIARDYAEQALGLYRRLGDEAHAAVARNNIGLIHKQLCEWDSALACFRSVLETRQKLGLYAETVVPLMNMGIVHQKMGEWAAAEEHYRACESVLVQVGNDILLSRVYIGLGNVARLQRKFPEAETQLLAALDRARRNAANREEVLALEFLGELDFDRGRPERAVARYHEAMVLAERSAPEGDLIVEIERRRAEALVALGRLDEAERSLDRATRLARLTDDKLEHAIAHRVAGEVSVARGRRLDARQSWEQAATLLAACRERFESARVQLLLARSTDDARAARTHALRACSLFAEVGSTHWQEQAEVELARVMGPGPVASPTRSDSLLGKRHRAPGLVAASNAMRTVEALARRAAVTELSVLITGETGTGKELVARTIHSQSPRAARPFLAVNCGALRADLALSQLFGHRKGAFTGAHAEGVGLVEAAHGGTLFLDEAGELPLDVQVTLLRFLESGEYLRLGETQVRRADVRIIAATNRVLRGGDAERMFRRDLLYRLNEIEIRLPALRERGEDIVPLAKHFLSFYGGLDGPRLSHDGESLLVSYGWPGNVRELENVMKRLTALHADSGELDARAILPLLADPPQRASEQADRRANERDEIVTAWRQAHGNKSRLADLLGISRKTLYARLKRLDLKL
jgi:DNA-binding NtrC family response regulator/tetratricopeptide (TPR) repeat protein